MFKPKGTDFLSLLYFSCLCSAHAPATKDQCVLANPLWSMFVELTGLCLVLFGQPPFHFPVSLCQIIFLLLALFHTFFPYFGLICSCVCFLFGWSSFSQREPAWLIHAHSISCPSCLFSSFLFYLPIANHLLMIMSLLKDEYILLWNQSHHIFACNWEQQNVLLISVADSLVAYRLKY